MKITRELGERLSLIGAVPGFFMLFRCLHQASLGHKHLLIWEHILSIFAITVILTGIVIMISKD